MVFILKLLHGAYAYLLIFQIGIIGVLTLMLLWLIVKRTKNQVLAGAGGALHQSASAPVDVTSMAEYQALQAKLAGYEAERSSFVSMKNDYDALQQKVKFLESKLLEYEILQEEIGTLSSLKVENEKLKKEIVTLQGEVTVRQNNFAEATREPQAEAPVQSTPAAPAEPNLSTSPTVDELADLPPAAPPVVASSNESANPDLDSLLKEIDALTGGNDQPKT